MKTSYFQILFLFPLIIIFSFDKSKIKYTDFEITIEKKRVDSINFKAKVIARDKSNRNNEDKIYILIDNEVELKSKIKNLKEIFLQNKKSSG